MLNLSVIHKKLNLNLNQQLTLITAMRVHITVHNCRTQHSTWTVLIICRLILQTIIIAQIMSTVYTVYCLRPVSRTKKYCPLINYALNHYQVPPRNS